MEKHTLVKVIYGNITRYICPHCIAVIELPKSVADIFIENDKPYACEDCGELIKFE